MREIEDFTDNRLKAWCIHCGAAIADIESNRDHVPTKSLLTKAIRERGADYDSGAGDEMDYLPQVVVCRGCNSSFSPDENYLLCVLHAVMAGSLYPDPAKHPEAATILRSNRHVVRSLKRGPDGQLLLFENLQPFTVFPDVDRVRRVILKTLGGTPTTRSASRCSKRLITSHSYRWSSSLPSNATPSRPPGPAQNFLSGQRSAAA